MFTQPAPVADAPAPPPIPAAPALPPTGEQQAILDTARTGDDLVIEAGAGTGKTTTLRMVATARPGHRMLYLAYNRAIADDARATFPGNVHCATAHSLAFRAIGHHYEQRLNGPRLPVREVVRILSIPQVIDLGHHALTAVKVARLVNDTVKTFCHSGDAEIYFSHVPDVPGLSGEEATALRGEIVPIARRAWSDITNINGKLRFEHDHYLKLWALAQPELPCNVVLLDEAQDANPLIAQIVQAQQAQRILVGDSSQAIYGWRGAVDAMANFTGQRHQLTQSWRFGQAVADQANRWLAILEAPLRLTGNPALESAVTRLETPAAILARTNAGAVTALMSTLQGDRRPALAGGGDDIRRLAEACRDLRSGRGSAHPELAAFGNWAEVRDYAEHDSGGSDLKAFVKLIDTHGPEQVLAVLDKLTPESQADVIVSTAHKAKGREWETVRIAADFGDPFDPATGEVIREEAMLSYVALTRAKLALDPGTLGVVHSPAAAPAPATPEPADSATMTTTELPAEAGYTPPSPTAELPPEATGWLDLAKRAADNAAHWKAIADHAIGRLQELAGPDAHQATVGGRPAFTWKPSKPAMSLDTTRLKTERPDIWEAYAKPKKPARPFRLDGEWK